MPLPPELPAPGRRLDLPGTSIGHGTNRAGGTGMTVLLCPGAERVLAPLLPEADPPWQGNTTLAVVRAEGLGTLPAAMERRRR